VMISEHLPGCDGRHAASQHCNLPTRATDNRESKWRATPTFWFAVAGLSVSFLAAPAMGPPALLLVLPAGYYGLLFSHVEVISTDTRRLIGALALLWLAIGVLIGVGAFSLDEEEDVIVLAAAALAFIWIGVPLIALGTAGLFVALLPEARWRPGILYLTLIAVPVSPLVVTAAWVYIF
jgi:hypothetical protein